MIFTTLSVLSLAAASLAGGVVSPDPTGQIRCQITWTPVGQPSFVEAQITLTKDGAYAAEGGQGLSRMTVAAPTGMGIPITFTPAVSAVGPKNIIMYTLSSAKAEIDFTLFWDGDSIVKYDFTKGMFGGKDAKGTAFGLGCLGVSVPNLAGRT
ncbi:uncharacterized protein L969DRAFT_94952 [Mixia osmundae IAM 14324]|uniref:Uncharacterized protein n=1 Tax=Mixia osmundae (strain CBS 9802 / IAM 14324 / JCM 22182 / KY 12970) TaxID=764103 RepID=G7E178_MIXOS|nr:uncharacterized protein L969DRAFT_94952 [Mixia osmundae IAM 14324]KEI38773.1 hypothetical protein L969DRAFT_94952 [Mixia osmundae IAM 14324]GAA96588.1 hypothetical protein E5Q_03258 [Mixia osmundae IAM 14324]